MVSDSKRLLIFCLVLFSFISCKKGNKQTETTNETNSKQTTAQAVRSIECSSLNEHLDLYLKDSTESEFKIIKQIISESDSTCDTIENFINKLWVLEGEELNIETLHTYKLYWLLLVRVQGAYLEGTFLSLGWNSYKFPKYFCAFLDSTILDNRFSIDLFVNPFGATLFETKSGVLKWKENLQKRKDVFSDSLYSSKPYIQAYLAELDRKLIEAEEEIKYLDSLEIENK